MHRDTFSFIAAYLSLLPLCRLLKGSSNHFSFFLYPSLVLLLCQQKIPSSWDDDDFLFHFYHDRCQNNQWSGLEEIRRHLCRNTNSTSQEIWVKNEFVLPSSHSSHSLWTCTQSASKLTISASLLLKQLHKLLNTCGTNAGWEDGSLCQTNAVTKVQGSESLWSVWHSHQKNANSETDHQK